MAIIQNQIQQNKEAHSQKQRQYFEELRRQTERARGNLKAELASFFNQNIDR